MPGFLSLPKAEMAKYLKMAGCPVSLATKLQPPQVLHALPSKAAVQTSSLFDFYCATCNQVLEGMQAVFIGSFSQDDKIEIMTLVKSHGGDCHSEVRPKFKYTHVVEGTTVTTQWGGTQGRGSKKWKQAVKSGGNGHSTTACFCMLRLTNSERRHLPKQLESCHQPGSSLLWYSLWPMPRLLSKPKLPSKPATRQRQPPRSRRSERARVSLSQLLPPQAPLLRPQLRQQHQLRHRHQNPLLQAAAQVAGQARLPVEQARRPLLLVPPL